MVPRCIQVFLETSALDPLKLELQALYAAQCGCWKLNQHLLQDQSALNREPSLQPPPSPLSFLTLPLTQTLPQASLQSLYSKYNRRKLFFSAKMQILLPLQSIKTRSEERGFFLADAPSEGAETKLWRPDALKALGSLGSYEPLLDLEVFIEYPVI